MKTVTQFAETVISYPGWLLLLAAVGFYGYSIYEAIEYTFFRDPKKDSPVLATTKSALQAILLTNLGVALGISLTNRDSPVARAMGLAIRTRDGLALVPPAPIEKKEYVQVGVVLIFLISLVVCVVAWITIEFSMNSSECVPVIYNSRKMFTGVAFTFAAAILAR